MSNEARSRETYHHGNLTEALVQEGAKLLAEEGVEGFSLRKIARRIGVTVAAPSHHFGSAKGLLTAIATEGFARLAARLEGAAASAHDPPDVVISMCRAYVESGASDPGYAAVMFRLDLLNADDEPFRECAFHAFDLLKMAVAKAAPEAADPAQISIATKALWAAMHGIVALPMIEDQEAEVIIRSAVGAHLARLR